jgi:hypothetical protein
MPDRPTAEPGRRAAAAVSRRPSSLTVLAVLIPLLTVGALALVRAPADPTGPRPPADAELTRTTLVCPGALPGATEVLVGHTNPRAAGVVETRVGDEGRVRLSRGSALTESDDPLVLVGEGAIAPGLLAGRGGDGVAASCKDPAPDQWFTGVSAGPEHSSVLDLVNPDGGTAVADITLLGPDGPLDVPRLRGVTVRGRDAVSFDLAQVAPSRDVLAMRVQVTRGRLGAHVTDLVDEVGEGARSADWMPAQEEPATTSHLLGLGELQGERTLVLANPGDDEARVGIEVVTTRSEFAPSGLEEVRVAPGSVEVVEVGDALGGRTAEGATGLRVESSVPVTAGLRSVVAGDLSHAVAGSVVEERAAAVVPPGPKRLHLGGADAPGVAVVVTRDGEGRPLGRERVEVDPGKGVVVDLPGQARMVDVSLDRTGAVASVEATDGGLAVLPLAELALTGRVPDVIPALG